MRYDVKKFTLLFIFILSLAVIGTGCGSAFEMDEAVESPGRDQACN
ncbi:MAG: hypothetical protein U5N58_13575 [Actinomycetota bacterium]|nr:hypothetical protein [Actinomycetota bacterium]